MLEVSNQIYISISWSGTEYFSTSHLPFFESCRYIYLSNLSKITFRVSNLSSYFCHSNLLKIVLLPLEYINVLLSFELKKNVILALKFIENRSFIIHIYQKSFFCHSNLLKNVLLPFKFNKKPYFCFLNSSDFVLFTSKLLKIIPCRSK